MSPAFSLAHLTVLGLSPPEMVETAARHGYGYVGLRPLAVTEQEPAWPLHRDPVLRRDTRERLRETGVRVLDTELCRLSPDVRVADFLPVLEVSAELGAAHVIAGAVDGDLSRLADHFAQLCDLAAPFQLSVNIEPVTFFPVPDIARAAQVVRQAGRPNGGILVDTLHFARGGNRLEELAALPRDWLRFAQLSDAPAAIPPDIEGLKHTARAARLYLGEGGIDVRAILAQLPPMPYSLENPNAAAVAAYGWDEHARRTLEAARRYLGA